MKKNLALALVVMFVISLASPAIAQGLNHSISAQIEGDINWKSQAGHLCNTGAEQKKTIMGSAEIFELERSVVMIEGRLTVTDMNDFVAGDNGLAVTSVIELCAPPKMEFTTTKYVPIAGTVVVDPFFGVGVYAYIIDDPDPEVFDEIKITEVEVDGSFRTRFYFTNPGDETSTQEIIALLELYDSDNNLKKSEEERQDRTIDPDRTFQRGIWIDLPIETQFHEGIAEAGDYFLFTAKAGSNEETWRVDVLEAASGGMGSISGFVAEIIGSEPFPIAGATVTATSNPSHVTTSGSNGNFSMPVPVGTYTVEASKDGYQVSSEENVVVNENENTVVNINMEPDQTIDIAEIPGVTAPVLGEAPVAVITETAQYTGTVTWSPDEDPFEAEAVYTATITLTAKEGFTLDGVAEDFFTVAGADTVTHAADSGEVAAVFPVTEAAPDQTITLLAIPGVVAPETGADQVTTAIDTDQYTGAITWAPDEDPFNAEEVYTANIVLTATAGWTLDGVAENSFTVDGADTVTHAADSGEVAAVFPVTGVAPEPLALDTTAPLEGEVDVDYAHSFVATGGDEPYYFAVKVGSLPDGLNLAADGKLSGTPTVAGTFAFTVEVKDAEDVADDHEFSVTINPAAEPQTTTFDQVYRENVYVTVAGSAPGEPTIWYEGIEEVGVAGVYNIYLDKAKIEAEFGGPLQAGQHLKIELDGQFLRDGDLEEIFIDQGDFYTLAAVQQGNNEWTTIEPETIGYEDGDVRPYTHAAVIHLVTE